MSIVRNKTFSITKKVRRMTILWRYFIFVAGLLLFGACQQKEAMNSVKKEDHVNLVKLKNHTKEFRQEIIKLNPNVYVAVGFDGSNTSMIIGEDGVIIIDALRSLGAAEKVAEAFRKICPKPVKAVIYTHGHEDHTGGTSAFTQGNNKIPVIAREGFKKELQEKSPVRRILQKRNERQFGRVLPKEQIINRGVAPGYTSKDRVGKGYIKPTRVFKDSLTIQIAGIPIHLYAANGETNDALFVWCPKYKSLFTGDNYYKAFPNLYAIRGSRYRDIESWGNMVLKMSTFPSTSLIPGHTRPLKGKENIHKNLTNYATAILSVYHQTIDAMNEGYTLQETVDRVQLADSLKEQSNLQEFYGSVAWGVRSIYTHYVGWFDGNPTNLYPLTEKKEAQKMISLAGGASKTFDKFDKAYQQEEYQWALQLSDYLIITKYKVAEVTKIQIKCLRALASQQLNAPARNYYLSCAEELNTKQ
ncbi:alkyl/aryl-sulfatase [Halosquirtibacter laminarini]|uniref:Alkyl/aryl-sulfatase n=1 Tax=Halosquirtibacter laminarini TaxID=3374600 RepID=A0AC61NGP1_9BACT|nr:alkyl/aryl-sulfatase [Prolixibacteraceae bacterium]